MEEKILNCNCLLKMMFEIDKELEELQAFNKAYLINLFKTRFNELLIISKNDFNKLIFKIEYEK